MTSASPQAFSASMASRWEGCEAKLTGSGDKPHSVACRTRIEETMRAAGRDEEVSNRRGARIRQRVREQRTRNEEEDEAEPTKTKSDDITRREKKLRINHSSSDLRPLQVRDALRNHLSKRWRVCVEALLFECARWTHAPDSANGIDELNEVCARQVPKCFANERLSLSNTRRNLSDHAEGCYWCHPSARRS